MPPKANAKKVVDEIDMSDIKALPKVNFNIFSVCFRKFKNQATRDKVTDHVIKNFPEDRVKTLTR
jgi:hypothetical protein